MIVSGNLLLDDGKSNGETSNGETSNGERSNGEKSSGGGLRIAPGYLRIEDGRIEECVEGEYAGGADFGSDDCLISPGFVDAHTHLPQYDAIGAHGLPLLQWLDDVIFPAERRWQRSDFAAEMTHRVIDHCYRYGTTAICGFATVHHESAKSSLRIARQRGLRGHIGQVLMDRHAPRDLIPEPERQIDQTADLIDHFPPGERMSAAITPRFAVSCSHELMQDAGQLGSDTGAFVQSHLAESVQECELVGQLFDNANYVQVYRQSGLLRTKPWLGHGVHLSDDDCRQLADHESVVVHCPCANSFLRSGTMDRQRLKRHDVAIALGSDIGAGYERSMIRVARASIEAAALWSDQVPTASHAWWQVTHGTPKLLGWQDWRRFETGAPADLVVIRPDFSLKEERDDQRLLSRVLFSWDDRWIETTLVAGQQVYPR